MSAAHPKKEEILAGVGVLTRGPIDASRRADLLGELEGLARALPREEIAGFLGEIERVRVSILMSVAPAQAEATSPAAARTGDRLLNVGETAARLGRSVSWVYKNKHALPMVPLPTGGYGFSELKLERWISCRSGD